MFSNLQDLHPDIPISNLVDVTASSYQDESGVCQSLGWSKPVSIIEKHKTRGWYNTAQSYEAWIAFDITKVSYLNNFYIIGYQIQVFTNCCYPINWDIQTRKNNESNWITVSSENEQKPQLSTGNFIQYKTAPIRSRQIRLFATKNSCPGTYKYWMGLQGFDLIYRSKYATKQCIKRLSPLFLYITLLI